MIKKPIEQRFWEKVKKGLNCWLWTGAVTDFGHGQINADWRTNKRLMAHRLSYLLAYGDIPGGLRVLHHCDNPSCVKPQHLFLGTDRDNTQDSVRKNRHTVGERNGQARLTWDQIAKMRKLRNSGRYTMQQLATMFGVSKGHVVHIINNTRWPIKWAP